MSHWAEIDDTNTVLRVLVGDNNDPAGDEGYLWLINNLGGTWVKTSYNAATNGFRKNYAGVGYYFDEARDAFIAPKPFDSWVLDEETCRWEAPTPYPTDGLMYSWVEADLNWQAITLPTE
jgi:hypothetical protein